MKTNQRIAIASACGATIGYGLGTTFMSGAWLILATLIGGVCGWIAFSPITLISTFFSVLKEKISNKYSQIRELWDEPWGKILPRTLRHTLEWLLFCQSIGAFLFDAIVIPAYVFKRHLSVAEDMYYLGLLLYIAVFIIGICSTIHAMSLFLLNKTSREKLIDDESYSVLRKSPTLFLVNESRFFLLTNPISLPFTLSWYMFMVIMRVVKNIVELVPHIPIAVSFLWLLMVKTFVLAHNNGRLASFVGASMGTVIGLMTNYVIIGMMSGIAVGLLTSFIGSCFPDRYVRMLASNLFQKFS